METWLSRELQPCWYHTWRELTRCLFESFYNYERLGTSNLPHEGAALIVANHQSYFDPPLIGDCFENRQFFPVARSELFEVPIFGRAIAMLNSIPIAQGKVDTRAIKQIIHRLETGNPVLIFPEGSRTHDGRIQPFERGVGVILRRTRVPVIPAAIDGAYEAWPRSRQCPRLFGQRLRVIFGEPIPPGYLPENPDEAVGLLEQRVRTLHEELRAIEPERG
ncbi:MAG: lysophospholipid acyltransferase family protein [Planctomycetota bacterium]|jgi:1-acyl-sn-glycerol-3-phosphate acyltransferase